MYVFRMHSTAKKVSPCRNSNSKGLHAIFNTRLERFKAAMSGGKRKQERKKNPTTPITVLSSHGRFLLIRRQK